MLTLYKSWWYTFLISLRISRYCRNISLNCIQLSSWGHHCGEDVSECSEILWEWLDPLYMKMPQNSEEWEIIAVDFAEKWHFPHSLGAFEGKHVVMELPWNLGTLYFNYKGTFSTVLLALAYGNLKFTAIDIGANGRNSDSAMFALTLILLKVWLATHWRYPTMRLYQDLNRWVLYLM